MQNGNLVYTRSAAPFLNYVGVGFRLNVMQLNTSVIHGEAAYLSSTTQIGKPSAIKAVTTIVFNVKTPKIIVTFPKLTLSPSGDSMAMMSVVRSSGLAVLASLACSMSLVWKDISRSTRLPSEVNSISDSGSFTPNSSLAIASKHLRRCGCTAWGFRVCIHNGHYLNGEHQQRTECRTVKIQSILITHPCVISKQFRLVFHRFGGIC